MAVPGSDHGLVFPYPDDDFFDSGIPKGVISPSGFGSYRICPRRYEYSYVHGIINPPGIALVKGKSIHKGAEIVHRHTIKHQTLIEMEDASQQVADYFEKEKEDIEDWADKDVGAVKDNTISNFQVYYRVAVPLIRPVAAEKPFAQRIGTVPVRGVIDLIDKVPDEWAIRKDPDEPPPDIEVVSDLKTTKRKWPDYKVAHDAQMTIYAIIEDTPYVRVDLLLDGKTACKYSPLRAFRDVNEKRLLVEDIEEVVDCIKQGIFPRCDPTHWACTPKFCGYYTRCRGPK